MTEVQADTSDEKVPEAPPAPAEEMVAAAPAGDPVPLGLLVFALGSTVLGISLLGYVPLAVQGNTIMPIVFAATGLGLLVTTVWAAALGQTFVATVIPLLFSLILGAGVVGVTLITIGVLGSSTGAQRAGGVFVLVFAALGHYGYLGTAIVSVGGKPLPFGKPALSLLGGK